MNHHLRFANRSVRPRGSFVAALALSACAASLFTGCQHSGDRLLSVSESVPPRLARDKPYLHVQCYFFTAPDDFELLENTEGAHVAGLYSPQDGERLVSALKRKRGFELTSAPTVTVRMGERGKLQTIREFIYPTEYTPPQLSREIGSGVVEGRLDTFPVTPATPTEFESVNLGVSAEFEGRSNSRGEIECEIDLARTVFLGFINYGSPITSPATGALGKPVTVTITENRIEMPVFDTKRLSTTVTLPDGHFLALGGLKPATPRIDRVRHPEGVSGASDDADRNFFVLVKVSAVGADGQ